MISKILRQNSRYKALLPVESDSIDEAVKDFGLNDEQAQYINYNLPKELVGIMKRPGFPRPFFFELDP